MKDYYEILDVPKDATPADIKKQYRRLAKFFHPDHLQHRKDEDKVYAEDKLKDINEAYEVLSDSEKRAKYDAQRKRQQSAPKANPQAPRPEVFPNQVLFELKPGETQVKQVRIENRGGPASNAKVVLSRQDTWFQLSQLQPASPTAPFPLQLEITAEAKHSASQQNYHDWLEIYLDDVSARVELQAKVIAPKPQATPPPPPPKPDPPPHATAKPSPSPISKPSASRERRVNIPKIILNYAIFIALMGGIVWTVRVNQANNTSSSPPSTALEVSQPSAPTGQLVFFAETDGGSSLYLAHADGGNARALNIQGQRPALSPSGQHIAFVGDDGQLYTVDSTGGNLTRLSSLQGEVRSLQWFSDQDIIFVANGLVYRVNSLGTDLQRLSESVPGDSHHLALAPDKSQIALDSAENGESRIYAFTLSEQNLTQLTDFDSSWPTWSADGTTLIVASERGLFVMDAQGKNQRRLSTKRAWWPTWSPDGSQIAYLSDQGDDQLKAELWLMDADGRNQRRLTTSGCAGYTWSPDGQYLAYISGGQLWQLHLESSEKAQVTDLQITNTQIFWGN